MMPCYWEDCVHIFSLIFVVPWAEASPHETRERGTRVFVGICWRKEVKCFDVSDGSLVWIIDLLLLRRDWPMRSPSRPLLCLTLCKRLQSTFIGSTTLTFSSKGNASYLPLLLSWKGAFSFVHCSFFFFSPNEKHFGPFSFAFCHEVQHPTHFLKRVLSFWVVSFIFWHDF